MSKNGYSRERTELCRSILMSLANLLNKPDTNLSTIRLTEFTSFVDLGPYDYASKFKKVLFEGSEGEELLKNEVDFDISTLIETLKFFSAHMIAEMLDFDCDSMRKNQNTVLRQDLGARFTIVLVLSPSVKKDAVYIVERQKLRAIPV